MADTGPKKAEFVARLFEPTTRGYRIVEKFGTIGDCEAWEVEMKQEHRDWEFQYHVHTPWLERLICEISEDVRTTGKPRVYFTRPAPDDL
jgi:hypothetical protein